MSKLLLASIAVSLLLVNSFNFWQFLAVVSYGMLIYFAATDTAEQWDNRIWEALWKRGKK